MLTLALLKDVFKKMLFEIQDIFGYEEKPVRVLLLVLAGWMETSWLYLRQGVKWYYFAKENVGVPIEEWFQDVDQILYDRAMKQEAEEWYRTH